MKIESVVALVLLAGLPVAAEAGDWPQFRGSNRDGLAVGETGLARTWPAEGPKELWRLAIGAGFSAVVVQGDRVWTAFGDEEQEWVGAFEAASGKELWRTRIGDAWKDDVGIVGPRSTPTLVDGVLYTVSSRATVHALDANTGGVAWKVDLLERFGAQVPRFGYSPSPLVHAGLVLVDSGGGEGKAYAALDAKTGDTRWTVGDGRMGYSSPIVAEIGGTPYFVFASRKLMGVDVGGKVAWSADSLPGLIVSPVFLPPDKIFLSASENVGGALFQVVPGDPPTVTEVWRNTLMKNHFTTSVLYHGHLYGFDNGTLKCLDAASGEMKWARRGYGKGTLTIADGLLYVLSESGKLVVGEAGSAGFTETGALQVLTGAKAWTPPTIANGRIYVRHQKEMVALDGKG